MMLILSVFALAVGTFAFRWAGPALRDRIRFTPRLIRLMETGAVVLMAGLVAVTALPLTESNLGLALPAGVVIAGLLAWRKQPILVVVLGAAVTTAALRAFGVS